MHAAFLLVLFLTAVLTYPTDLTQECVDEIRAAYEKHIFISKEQIHDHPAILKKVMQQINLHKCMNVTMRFKITKLNETIQITGVHRKPKNEHKVNKEHTQPHHENNQQDENSEEHQYTDHTVHSFINNEHNGNTYPKQNPPQYPSNNNGNVYNQNQDRYSNTNAYRNGNYGNSYRNQNRRQGDYNNPRRPNENDYNLDDEDLNTNSNGNYESFYSDPDEPKQYSDNTNDDEINSYEKEDPNGYQPNENDDNSYTDTNPPMSHRKDYTRDDSPQYSTPDDFQQLSTTSSDLQRNVTDSQMNDGGFTQNESKKQSTYSLPISDSNTSKKDDTTTPIIDTYTNNEKFSSSHPYKVNIENLNQYEESTTERSQHQINESVSSDKENKTGYTATPIPNTYKKTDNSNKVTASSLNRYNYTVNNPNEPYDNMNPSKENETDFIPNVTETTTPTLTSQSTEVNIDYSEPISDSSDQTKPDEKDLLNKQDVTTEKVNINNSSSDKSEITLAENVTSPKTTQGDKLNSVTDANNEQTNKTNSQNSGLQLSEFVNTYPVAQTEVYFTTEENNNKEQSNSKISHNKEKNDMEQYSSYEYSTDDKHNEYNLYDEPKHTNSFTEHEGIYSGEQNWNQKTKPKTSSDDENFNKPSKINRDKNDHNNQIQPDLNTAKTNISDIQQQADKNMEPITHNLYQTSSNYSPLVKKDQNEDENEDINKLEVISLPLKDNYKKVIKSHNQELEDITENIKKKPHVSDKDKNAKIDKSQQHEDDTNNIKNIHHDQLNINKLNNPENNNPRAFNLVKKKQETLTQNIPTKPKNSANSDKPTAMSHKKQHKLIDYDDDNIPTEDFMPKSTKYFEKLKRRSMERQELEQKKYLPAVKENSETVKNKDTETAAVNIVRTIFCKILVTLKSWITEIIRVLSKNTSEECTSSNC